MHHVPGPVLLVHCHCANAGELCVQLLNRDSASGHFNRIGLIVCFHLLDQGLPLLQLDSKFSVVSLGSISLAILCWCWLNHWCLPVHVGLMPGDLRVEARVVDN